MAVCSAVAALPGAFYVLFATAAAHNYGDFSFGTEMVVWTALGGRGTLAGPILGTIGINYVSAVLGGNLPFVLLLFGGFAFVLVVVYLPQGVVPALGRGMSRAGPARPRSARRGRARRGREVPDAERLGRPDGPRRPARGARLRDAGVALATLRDAGSAGAGPPRGRDLGAPAVPERAGRPPLARGEAGPGACDGARARADGAPARRADGGAHARRAGGDRQRAAGAGPEPPALPAPHRARPRLRPRDQHAARGASPGENPPRWPRRGGGRRRAGPDDLDRRGLPVCLAAPV